MWATFRATRLGVFSPNGRLFSLGRSFKPPQQPKFWAAFWAIFSQQRLVTLPDTYLGDLTLLVASFCVNQFFGFIST
jgi:hypothetical protein